MKYYTSTTEYNCGIDLHARQMYVCLMDRQGKKLVHTNVKDNDFDYFLKLVEPYKHSLTVCCECMFGVGHQRPVVEEPTSIAAHFNGEHRMRLVQSIGTDQSDPARRIFSAAAISSHDGAVHTWITLPQFRARMELPSGENAAFLKNDP
jgi:hypothetical protein